MTLDPALYPRSRTLDARSAIARALARVIGGMTADVPASSTPTRLRTIHSSWANFSAESATSRLPVAAILPDRASYAPAGTAPRLLENTWWTDGVDGWGLYEVAVLESSFLVAIRAATEPSRAALIASAEGLLTATGAPGDRPRLPIRYGAVLPLPEYWGLSARAWLKSIALLDTAASATASRWDAQIEVGVEGPVCRLLRTPAMAPRIRLVDDVSGLPIER